MTADQKLQNVEAQMRAVLRGATNIITCPYCTHQNRQPSDLLDEPEPPICCADLGVATGAVIQKLELDGLLDAASRIAENAERNVSSN